MTRERASIFAGDDTLDVSAFAPKAAHELNGASAALVRGIAEASRFPSREAKTSSAMRRPTHTSDRPHDAVQRPHDAANCPLCDRRSTEMACGRTLEHALAALQRELSGRGSS